MHMKSAVCYIFIFSTINLTICAVLSWTAHEELANPGGLGAQNVGEDSAFMGPDEPSSYNKEEDDWEDEQFLGLAHLPPGEEGFLQSHAGGEAVVHDIMDSMSFSYVVFILICDSE